MKFILINSFIFVITMQLPFNPEFGKDKLNVIMSLLIIYPLFLMSYYTIRYMRIEYTIMEILDGDMDGLQQRFIGNDDGYGSSSDQIMKVDTYPYRHSHNDGKTIDHDESPAQTDPAESKIYDNEDGIEQSSDTDNPQI